jgi:Lon protease-like protein
LSTQLAHVYEQFPQVGNLYQKRFYDDPSWVPKSWLELLPLNRSLCAKLVGADGCIDALTFLTPAIEAPNESESRIWRDLLTRQ